VPIVVPMRFADAPLLWTLDDVYSAAECAGFIAAIERASPALATDNPIYRDQDRVIVDDAAIAGELYRRLRPHLPERIGPLTLHGLNPRLRMYRYRTGQRFAPHTDHWYMPDDRTITLLTVLVYFNGDFEGGETRFYEQIERTIAPRAGSVAIFQHKLRHEGCELRRGSKYAMRSDVFYKSPEPLRLPG
jgi:Rps23 Pro-64 3,4-dihydroxylase Tpa1-like proline 4-hydroxylase